jgi:hypothetical protein
VAAGSRKRLGLVEERPLFGEVAGAGDSLEAVDFDWNRQGVLTELPLEPFVVGTHAFMRGEDEVEVVRDRRLRVEERCQLESRAHVLGGPVVGVDVPVERFRRRRRIDLRHLRQLRRDLSRLVEGGRRPRHGRQHPVR